MADKHIPVLLRECIEGLNIKPDGIYIDGTLGRGGHSIEIAKRLDTGMLIAIDRDSAAIDAAKQLFSGLGKAVKTVKGNFCDLSDIMDDLGVEKADGMLFDLGVSSPQLDDSERGFSYSCSAAPLDMRMDREAPLTAEALVNTWPEAEIKRILWEYGEERYSGRIAAAIVRERAKAPVVTAGRLVDIIRAAMPASALREKQHPAKRSFQAIRIAVNDELGALERMLQAAPDRLNSGGRLAVISFHSLEDRLVKNAIRARENGCTCPPGMPVCACGFVQTMRTITKKPIVPGKDEIENNPRARSARLRVAERI
ncbi:MAG: 16S rRNA (cytosine(1402)-N(4))-methyltransferase RsmH [Oscillospiraceae bacterium]|nr:16S rRNA (cytosine(1402)-N(4))-methyltransferase RsmH [Oscillospiraceae bacterium]